jgi:alpha,alpha-trehalose phosphorylase
VEITPTRASYLQADGEPLEISHHGTKLTLKAGKPQKRLIPATPIRPRPSQPSGREPARRRPIAGSSA